MPAVRIDRSKPLSAEPRTGHNRYHPDIEPVLEVAEGEEVVLETRDAIDGQLKPTSTVADFANLNPGAIHPLTGPVFGLACGVAPTELYLSNPIGTASAVAGVVLIWAGRLWCRRLVESAMRGGSTARGVGARS